MDNTATKLQKARVITALDDYRQESLSLFQNAMHTSQLKDFLESQGNGELKLLIDRIKEDLLSLETKLENLL